MLKLQKIFLNEAESEKRPLLSRTGETSTGGKDFAAGLLDKDFVVFGVKEQCM